MFNNDRLIQETHAKKNELESYIYDMRSKLNEHLSDYTTPKITNDL